MSLSLDNNNLNNIKKERMTSLDKNEENKNINQNMNKTFQRIQKK